MEATYGATEMVIAVRPYGVLRKKIRLPTQILYTTGELQHLA